MSPLFALFTGAPGLPELLIIAVIVLVLFGKRLPSVMRSLGTSITEFKKGINDVSEEPTKSEESAHSESRSDA
ncbi:Sec-independent protein translocase subunit TatA/TatB [Stratiformator vulcanicus]|uniref:Sec-independent protein translocase protein TatA n=1 Tax=Stratiformator vulcanicus TaxID=2527980 RepID=A0A517R2T7_9PLAN|nr:twin-arginine translocase TatA/TatE family subunit [Stratiformator vulcanicus]QDT38196.1 Sec-independent protein translocase protein TatA [Stratiformator vulcanicus]